LNQETSRVLVPPRPNLGPEPWSEVRSSRWPVLAILILAMVLLGGWTVLRRRRKARDTRKATAGRVISLDDSPSGKLLNLADEVRGTLITRFGPAMRARTTEEIAADPQVKDVLGAERLDPLIRLLAEADRWKFANQPGNGREQSLLTDLSGWNAWHEALLADNAARAKPQPSKKSKS
jgi:hypothetical protein